MGNSAVYHCDNCGFTSQVVFIGVGMSGIERLPASCFTHKGMTTLARPYRGFELPELSEAERTRCSECGAGPTLLVGPEPWPCPECGEPHLTHTSGGILWD